MRVETVISDPTVLTVPTVSTVSTVLLLLLLTPSPSPAQQATVAGRVVRTTASDTLPLPRARVILHRIARASQGPLDSTVTGLHGEFRFRFKADTSAVYLLSSSWSGIEYFSSAIHTNPELPDTGLVIAVSDTSSTTPLETESRHIVYSKPGADGTRPALEIVVIGNSGATTRIAPDSVRAAWGAPLPRGVVGFQGGSSDFSSEALLQRGDSVLLFAPVSPGEKQVIFTYSLPPSAGPVRLPLGDSIGVVNILLEEFDRRVSGGSITRGDSQQIEGRSFRQWSGSVGRGDVVEIDFPGRQSQWVLPALVGGVALALALVGLKSLGRRGPALAAPQPSLLDQLARLDQQYAGRQDQLPATEWERYQSTRARLKAELNAQLARPEPPA